MHSGNEFDDGSADCMDSGESGSDNEVNTSSEDETNLDSDTLTDLPDARVRTKSFTFVYRFSAYTKY